MVLPHCLALSFTQDIASAIGGPWSARHLSPKRRACPPAHQEPVTGVGAHRGSEAHLCFRSSGNARVCVPRGEQAAPGVSILLALPVASLGREGKPGCWSG